jgi:hypothetical protein
LLIAILVLTAATARPLSAWNDAGHLIVARIAWNQLSPAERDAVVSILRKHPHHEQLLLKDRHTDATNAEWIFIRAAVWPDHIRPPRTVPRHELDTHPVYKFHRPSWHYVNFPYRAGQTAITLPAEPIRGEDPNGSNILQQLDLCMRLLMDDSLNDPDHVSGITHAQNKAVRLCWLLHLVGDLHQPLHVATLVDQERFPKGTHSDLGGNLLMIRPHAGAAPHKLHAFWDDRLGTNSHFPAVCDLAEMLTRDPHLAPAQLPELAQNRHLRQWAEEGYQYAKTTVYHDGRLQAALAEDYEHHRITADDVPVLPQAAEAAAAQVARRRIVLAGYRLAGLLKQILE